MLTGRRTSRIATEEVERFIVASCNRRYVADDHSAARGAFRPRPRTRHWHGHRSLRSIHGGESVCRRALRSGARQ
ncbi:unnamed protein product, partial [Iphiclides podalirius]